MIFPQVVLQVTGKGRYSVIAELVQQFVFAMTGKKKEFKIDVLCVPLQSSLLCLTLNGEFFCFFLQRVSGVQAASADPLCADDSL